MSNDYFRQIRLKRLLSFILSPLPEKLNQAKIEQRKPSFKSKSWLGIVLVGNLRPYHERELKSATRLTDKLGHFETAKESFETLKRHFLCSSSKLNPNYL